MDRQKKDINFLPQNIIKRRKKIKFVIIISLLFCMLLGIGISSFIYLQEQHDNDQIQLTHLKTEHKAIQIEKEELSELKLQREQLELEIQKLQFITEGRWRWPKVLAVIDDCVPSDDVWFISLQSHHESEKDNEVQEKTLDVQGLFDLTHGQEEKNHVVEKNDENVEEEVLRRPGQILISGMSTSAEYIGRFVYQLNTQSSFEKVNLQYINREQEADLFNFMIRAVLKEGIEGVGENKR